MILFRKTGQRYNNLPGLSAWKPVLASITRPRPSTLGRVDLYTDLQKVNTIVNRMIRPVYEKDDHWATIEETISTKNGDCEDYATLKMAILYDMGYPIELFCVAAVMHKTRNEGHAILVCTYGGMNICLDNLVPDVYQDIEVSYYDPHYAYTSNIGWLF